VDGCLPLLVSFPVPFLAVLVLWQWFGRVPVVFSFFLFFLRKESACVSSSFGLKWEYGIQNTTTRVPTVGEDSGTTAVLASLHEKTS
jgi:hypothetical protein